MPQLRFDSGAEPAAERAAKWSRFRRRNCGRMGFEEDESLLPYPRRSFDGYRLLQEYFTFSEKFLFFELSGLEAIAGGGLHGAGGDPVLLFAIRPTGAQSGSGAWGFGADAAAGMHAGHQSVFARRRSRFW